MIGKEERDNRQRAEWKRKLEEKKKKYRKGEGKKNIRKIRNNGLEVSDIETAGREIYFTPREEKKERGRTTKEELRMRERSS